MTVIKVIDRNANQHVLEATDGQKIMEALRELDYGVAAICGGCCSCATCHVYVDPSWIGRLPAALSDEQELLSSLSSAQANSRLSCQLECTAELAGLTLMIAPDE